MTDDTWKNMILVLTSVNYEWIRLRFPIGAVWAIGIIVAWRRRSLHPRV